MSNPEYKGGRWPTPNQYLLLKASLLNDDQAIKSWQIWKESVDIDFLDPGSFRLLPLLFSNLSNLRVKDPLMPRLKGVYRMSWYKNKMIFIQAGFLLNFLHQQGIETMLLKGVALQLLYYPKQGVRPMDDIDILVPSNRALSVINLLQKSSWRTFVGWEEGCLNVNHAHKLLNKAGYAIDLHWNVLSESIGPHADSPFWEASEFLNFHGTPTRVLNSSDQLLHACVHGIIPVASISSIRWIADAMKILTSPESEIDWKRILDLAEERSLKQHLKDTLGYLKSSFAAPIPNKVISNLVGYRPSFTEFVGYRIRTSLRIKIITGSYLSVLIRQIQLRRSKQRKFIPLGLVKSLRLSFGFSYTWQFVPNIFNSVIKKLKKYLMQV